MIVGKWIGRIWCSHMIDHIWCTIYDCMHMKLPYMRFTYDWSYMISRIWSYVNEFSVYDVHIWLIIYDVWYMIACKWIYRIWGSHMIAQFIYDRSYMVYNIWYSHMIDHIWFTVFDCKYMCLPYMMITYDYNVHIWCSYMISRIWLHAYDLPYMIVHIWSIIYEFIICDHIWFDDLPYMIICMFIYDCGIWWSYMNFPQDHIRFSPWDVCKRYVVADGGMW